MIQNFGRTLLLSAVAILMLHGGAGAAEESVLGRIPEFQKLLNQPIDYELAVGTTLDKALDELLVKQGVRYVVNDVLLAGDKDIFKKTLIGKIDALKGVSRKTVLKKLLAQIPNDAGTSIPTYVLRREHLEITILEALQQEFYADPRYAAALPPLTYAAFKETPFRDALAQLARDADVNVVLDSRKVDESKVTAELNAVPLDAALRLLANMHGLTVVRVANVYYVTSPKNARIVQNEEEEHPLRATPGAM